jgi:non-homologous end joining protein Ku
MPPLMNCHLSLGGINVPVKLCSATKQSNPPLKLVNNSSLSLIVPELIKSTVLPKNNILEFSYFCYSFDIPAVYYENFYYLLPGIDAETYYSYIMSQLINYDIVALTQAVIGNTNHLFALSVFSGLLILYKLRFKSQIIAVEPPVLPRSVVYAETFMDSFDLFLCNNTRPFCASDFSDVP